MSSRQRKVVEVLRVKGASVLLTARALDQAGCVMNRQEFRDTISLRYDVRVLGLSANCACGKANDVGHSMVCKVGGFPIMVHNEVRDIFLQWCIKAGFKNGGGGEAQ